MELMTYTQACNLHNFEITTMYPPTFGTRVLLGRDETKTRERAVLLANVLCALHSRPLVEVHTARRSSIVVYYGAGAGETLEAAQAALADYDQKGRAGEN